MFRIMSEPPQQKRVDAEDQEQGRAERQIDHVVQGNSLDQEPGSLALAAVKPRAESDAWPVKPT
jgi:hypothetical protein